MYFNGQTRYYKQPAVEMRPRKSQVGMDTLVAYRNASLEDDTLVTFAGAAQV